MDDPEGKRDQFVENPDRVGGLKRVSSRAGHAHLELKILVIPEKTGGHLLQGGGRIPPGENFPPGQNLKRLVQKNGLADLSPQVEAQDHLAFFPFGKKLTSMNPVNSPSLTARRDAHPFDFSPKHYTDLGPLIKENNFLISDIAHF
jgi:hypothetical protein